MNGEIYRFMLGDFECFAISDGNFTYPLEAFFGNVARKELEENLRYHNLPTDHISTPYTCLFVNTGEHRVLIDTGAGDLASSAAKVFPSVDHSTTVTGKLLQNIRAAGIEPGNIDIVIISHAHPDHIGGTLDKDGKLIFANAQYFIAREEWEFWTSETALVKTSPPMVHIARHNLDPLRNRLTLIDGATEIVPGIRSVAAHGHTPGHIAISITSNAKQLLHISDVVLYPLHLEHPEWIPTFDIYPEQAASSKHKIFNHAAEEQILIFAHHFPPFPNLGYVLKQAQGWQWQPITI